MCVYNLHEGNYIIVLKVITVTNMFLKFFALNKFFQSSFRFIEKLSGKYREFP